MAPRTALEVERPVKPAKSAKKSGNGTAPSADRERIFEAFRRWGYLEADLDPLGFLKALKSEDLDFSGPDADAARRIYSGTIGADFMHLVQPERRKWIADRLESETPENDRHAILERLVRADLFEQVLQSRYLGTKRFSLEGVTSLIPLLDSILDAAGEYGAIESVMAMSHRGRLNVMVHAACKTPHEVVAGFEDVDPRSVLGAGDVKYHVGATGTYVTAHRQRYRNSSCFEPKPPRSRRSGRYGPRPRKQTRHGVDGRSSIAPRKTLQTKLVPIVMHGDAAFAGQGILAETLNLADLKAYTVGGTVHIVVNNLIGFTTRPVQEHSSRFASDIAKRQTVPDFPRKRRRSRRRRSRRANSPPTIAPLSAVTSSWTSSAIAATATVKSTIPPSPNRYFTSASRIIRRSGNSTPRPVNVDADANRRSRSRRIRRSSSTKPSKLTKIPASAQAAGLLVALPRTANIDPEYEVDTGLSAEKIWRKSPTALVRVPEGFHVHPKIAKLLEQRAEMGHGKRAIDYGFAEALAFGSLFSKAHRFASPVRTRSAAPSISATPF